MANENNLAVHQGRRRLELLAPAKDLKGGKAAILHGADAVYIGPPRFGARAAVGNSVEDIRELCRFAHQYGAKVYATVNTLLHDDEIESARSLLEQLADASVDAVLIQDMRLLDIMPPSMAVHASTQADNRTAEQVNRLYDHGVRRAVLARELSVEEIAAIHRAVPQMELEVFVHGALCVSYSGLCYASEHCFRRSANRGECAQFCRMRFDLVDADGREWQHQRHLLSLKDLNLSMHLGELIEAGAVSFKIEGRLKDLAYVKNVTAAYSERLNTYIDSHAGSFGRASDMQCSYTFTPDLDRTFNRGYTTYFVHGRGECPSSADSCMASFDTPKATGQAVGRVKSVRRDSIIIDSSATIANGDGLCFIDSNRQLQGFRVNRCERLETPSRWRLFPLSMPMGLKPETLLRRSNDQAMEQILSRNSAERRIPVTMRLGVTSDGFELSSGEVTVRLTIEHQKARTPQREIIMAQLKRTGDSPFVCTSVDIPADFDFFIPNSQLATMRRMLTDALLSHIAERTTQSSADMPGLKHIAQPQSPVKGLLMQCRYCLRHEMGFCVKHGGRKADWHEPLMLRLADGRCFRLEFDCRKCQMNVWATNLS